VVYDKQVANNLQPQSPPRLEDGDQSSLTRSSSPQQGTKRVHTTDDDSDSDVDVHVSKTPKIEKKNSRPKAGDFSNSEKELVLVASNIYRVLLASRGPFPNTATEVKLIKKAWKKMDEESGLKARDITPTFITIVSISITL
jgi:hypothetical protein